MRKLLFLLLLLLPAFAFADTFVVTNNADSGPGTLRDALQKAADNGTAVTDNISFNLADVSETGRTIVIQSVLPNITSNLVIDGTTQPGVPFGVSNAPVRITINKFPSAFYFFFLVGQSAENVEIYGINIYEPYESGFSGCEFYGLSFKHCSNVKIGKPAKGNYFMGLTESIFADSSSNISIQSNIDGLDLDGSTSYQLYGGVLYYAQKAIDITNTNNILIGGPNSNQGNHIVAFKSINIQLCYFDNDTTSLKILNNKLGTNINDTSIWNGSSSVVPSSVFIKGNTSSVTFSNNIFTGDISLFNLTKYFYFQGNRLYNPNYSLDGNYITKIAVAGTAGGMIGGDNPGEANQIFYMNVLGTYAIVSSDVGVTILKNNIYCNETYDSPVAPNYYGDDVGYFDTYGRTYPWAIIDSLTNGYVKGRAKANCKIDIYQDDDCPACEGKMYLASTTSDAQGNWIYKGPFTGVVVATATDSQGTTFAFTHPFIRDDSMVIKLPTCGKKNGSVKGIQIIGGNNWEWRKVYLVNNLPADSLYSTKLDMDNIEPGKYILRPKLGATCNGYARTYTFADESPLLNPKYVEIIQPTCGQNTGSIMNMGGSGMTYSKLEWRNEKGVVVGTSYDLTNVGAGKYVLYAIDTSGGGCIDSSKVYVLINQSGPSLNTDSVKMAYATCGNANGSITNITYKNTTGDIYTAWVDTTGNIIGRDLNLFNVPAGRYKLKFKDGGGCDTIVTSYFTVVDKGTITIDTTLKLVKPSSCKGADGSITGITSTSATIFRWVNTATGDTVGRAININNIPAGVYQLLVGNIYGCQAQTGNINVGQSGFMQTSVSSATVTDAYCASNNGSIAIQQFTSNSSFYTFQWVDSSTNAVIPGSTNLQNLAPGVYVLYATDTNACRQRIYSTAIKQTGKPQFDYSRLRLVSDTCNLHIGDVLFYSQNAEGYEWAGYNIAGQPQSTSPLGIISVGAGQYYATITDKYKCTATSDTFTITNYDISPAAPQAGDQLVLRGTQATLQVTNAQPGKYNLYDTVNASIPVYTSEAGILVTPPVYYDKLFYIQYLRGDCASAMQQVWVKVYDSTVIKVPNAFSPNGDGINDVWRLNVQGMVSNYTLTVFNRYGQVVYTSRDINAPWDGTMNGKPLQVGTYYYIIQATDNNSRAVKQSGYIMLLK